MSEVQNVIKTGLIGRIIQIIHGSNNSKCNQNGSNW